MSAKALQAPLGLRVANSLFVAIPCSAGPSEQSA